MSWLKRKIAERANRNRAQSHNANYDSQSQSSNLSNSYYKKQKAFNRGRDKALEDKSYKEGYSSVSPPKQSTRQGSGSKGSGNSALAGLSFLSGDMGFGVGGNQTQDAVTDLLGFGGPSRSTQIKPKPKRTTINTGGKKITITETPEGETPNTQRRKGSNVFENLEKLMDQEWDW